MAIQTLRINAIDVASAGVLRSGTTDNYAPYRDGWGGTYENNLIYRYTNRIVGQAYSLTSNYVIATDVPNLLLAFQQTAIPNLQNRNIISMKIKFMAKDGGTYFRRSAPNVEWTFTPRNNDYIYFRSLQLVIPQNRIVPNATSGANSYSPIKKAFAYPQTFIRGGFFDFDIPTIEDFRDIMVSGIRLACFGTLDDPSFTGCSMNIEYQGTNAPYLEIVYDDAPTPPYVEGIYPNEIVVNNDAPLTFRWDYTQAFNQPQSHFDLQYYNGSSWQWLANRRASSAQNYTIPANTLPGDLPNGQTQWRVRSYIENAAVASAWSQPLPFIVRSGSPTPVITFVSRTPMFTLQWTAPTQTGYQVQIYRTDGETQTLVHDSGETTGTGLNYTYKYLEDGNYQVILRVVNSFGLWSAWATSDFIVTNTPNGSIQLFTRKTHKNTVILSWNTTTTYDRLFVLRDGQPIAVLESGAEIYEDCNSNGKVTYIIMGVNEPNYTYSNPSKETICVCNAQIALFNTNDKIDLKYRRGSRPGHGEEIEATVTYQTFEGRINPVAYKSINQFSTHNFEFSFRNRKDYEKLLTFNNQNVVYKDCKGNRVVGNLELTGIDHSISIDIQFTITITDIGEYLNYADY